MNQQLRHRARARTRAACLLASIALGALGLAAGCSDGASPAIRDRDDEATSPEPSADSGRTSPPAPTPPAPAPPDDAATPPPDEDASGGGDASDATAPLVGCAAHQGAAFCDDFDRADALMPGKTRWDFVELTAQPVATLSALRAVSAPSSLLSRVIDGTTPGAKFAKTVTKASFVEATWGYDIFLENVGATDGFFLDDFQFSDAVGPDTFGFRLVMFADAAGIKQLGLEHNQQVTGGPYVIEPVLPAGTVTLGKWHHLQQRVTFKFASADAGADAGAGNRVEYALTVDGAATPIFKKEYAGPTRQQAAFARIAGMPLIFNKANSAGLKVFWDNHVLELK